MALISKGSLQAGMLVRVAFFYFICEPETTKNEPKCHQGGMRIWCSILRELVSQPEPCWAGCGKSYAQLSGAHWALWGFYPKGWEGGGDGGGGSSSPSAQQPEDALHGCQASQMRCLRSLPQRRAASRAARMTWQ